jgi:hypothetical protein
MVAGNDATNLDAIRVLRGQQTSVKHMVAGNDATNLDAIRVLRNRQTSVPRMAAGNDALTVLHGLILVVDQVHMMDTVLRVSNGYFQVIQEAP